MHEFKLICCIDGTLVGAAVTKNESTPSEKSESTLWCKHTVLHYYVSIQKKSDKDVGRTSNQELPQD